MDLIVRGVEDHVTKKLDQMAKRKKLSRQEFLKEQIERLAAEEEISRHEKDYKDILEKVLYVLEENTLIMKMLREELVLDEDLYDKEF